MLVLNHAEKIIRNSICHRNKAIEALKHRDYLSVNIFVGSAHGYIVDWSKLDEEKAFIFF